jgi:deoxyribose-phosphate aldolase
MSESISHCLDYTLLRPDATSSDIDRLCQEAVQGNVFAVCIAPYWVERVKARLEGSSIKICSVVGFPLGSTLPSVKAFESAQLVDLGVDEIDMVMNIGAFKSNDFLGVLEDIQGVVKSAPGKIVKVIVETALLTDPEKIKAAQLVVESGAHFVKTSTGFAKSGATVEDIRLLRETVGPHFGVKASGGVRTREAALEMIRAGATRIGSSTL